MNVDGKSPEDYLKSQPKDKVKAMISSTANVMMVIEFICVVGIYIALKTYASLSYAELWMLVMYAWTLKSSTNTLEEHTLKRLEDKNEDNTQSKTIEECNDKD